MDLEDSAEIESVTNDSLLAVADADHVQNDQYSDLINGFKYWLDGPIGLTVASMGVLVNLVAIVVLARQRVQRTFHMLMIYLSFWDFTYLILFIICFAMPVMSKHFRDTVFIYLVPYAIPMAQICLSGSCYSTVALTVERYIAVCAPFFRLRHNIKARFYILPILIFAPLYNVPRFFEFKTMSNVTYSCEAEKSPPIYPQALNSSLESINNFTDLPSLQPFTLSDKQVNKTKKILMEEEFMKLTSKEMDEMCLNWKRQEVVDFVVTEFRRNPDYISVYVNYINLLVNLIIPTLILGVLNCLVYRALRDNSVLANGLRRTGGGEEALRKRDVRLTRIAIVIVCVFIICHLPRFIPNIVEMFLKELPGWFAIIISFNNLLQIVNCTVNYLIYFGHCWKRSEENVCNRTDDFEMESKPIINGHMSHSIRNSSQGTRYV